jgi:exodeoxyribonuclease VII large subunit
VELYKAYEQLKNKLALEGLFSPEYKKTLPRYPKMIGVATSETGAVLHDILIVLKRRYPVRVLFIPTMVQGEYAANSIVHSIELLNRTDADLIILGRGGGSLEDLWSFNEETVARAIFKSNIPIISAVGHETDYTIADFVADIRAPTPSAAAELAVPDRQELFNQVKRFREIIIERQKRDLNDRSLHAAELRECVEPGLLVERIANYMQYIDDIYENKSRSIERLLESRTSKLRECSGKLDAVSPLGTLSRGYSITLKLPDNTAIRSINDVEKNDEIQILVNDGKIKCDVNEKEECKWK